MGKDKIMPGIGCLNRRLYIEQRQRGIVVQGASDPCLTCVKRGVCVKPVVTF